MKTLHSSLHESFFDIVDRVLSLNSSVQKRTLRACIALYCASVSGVVKAGITHRLIDAKIGVMMSRARTKVEALTFIMLRQRSATNMMKGILTMIVGNIALLLFHFATGLRQAVGEVVSRIEMKKQKAKI